MDVHTVSIYILKLMCYIHVFTQIKYPLQCMHILMYAVYVNIMYIQNYFNIPGFVREIAQRFIDVNAQDSHTHRVV